VSWRKNNRTFSASADVNGEDRGGFLGSRLTRVMTHQPMGSNKGESGRNFNIRRAKNF